MNRKQHKWAGFRAPKLRICTPDIIDHIVLHRRHSPPKTSSTDTIRSGRACQKPLLPASSPPKSDDQNSQKSFNNSQLGPGIPSMSTFCGQYSLEKNFLIVRSQVFQRGRHGPRFVQILIIVNSHYQDRYTKLLDRE